MVRVRFAPSPTGPLHIGGVRTALFNYFFAKQNAGTLILRIEDTDQQRFVEGAENYIIESLKWSGVEFDEGPHVGGKFGPYRQSERRDIYVKYAQKLIDEGNAYYAFDAAEDLEKARAENPNFQYDKSSRLSMKNSLTLEAEEVKTLIENGSPYVIRVKIPSDEEIIVNDRIRGKVSFDSNLLDDKVIFKSDGLPTYHLANIVDDHLMEITHVIRGEEWLPSAPLHVILYKFLGWEHPEFAHLPLILKPQGSGKLSKRDGDKMGFPVFPLNWVDPNSKEISKGYKEWGFLPDAFVNMMALLGWNPGTVQEIFTKDELIEQFSLDKVQKSGAKFDLEKTKWFNHQYILNSDVDALAESFKAVLEQNNVNAEIELIKKITLKVRDRISLIPEFFEHSKYFFTTPQEYNEAVLNKHKTESSAQNLMDISSLISKLESWNEENIETLMKTFIQENQIPMGKIFNMLRLALTGSNTGIGIADIIFIIGKEEAVHRINKLKDFIS